MFIVTFCLENKSRDSFPLQPTTKDEIKRPITKINSGKAKG